MVIECSCCQARYRMKDSMMRGFKGAEVRCRKCGGTIAVLTPGTPPRTPAARIPDDRAEKPRPRLPSENSQPPAERREPSPGPVGHGLAGGEGTPRTRKALAEETEAAEPVPDNVYPLDLFREGRPKRLPTGGYDISHAISPDPPASPAGRESGSGSTEVAEPLRELRNIRSTPTEEPIHWHREGIAAAHPEESPAATDRSPRSGKSPANKSRAAGGSSVPSYPRPMHIAIVYLLLLGLGGFGYMLIRFISHAINGGIR